MTPPATNTPARLRLEPLEARDNPAVNFQAFGAAAGGQPVVGLARLDGTPVAQFPAFEDSFRGGVRAAAGEFDGNPGTVEVVAGAGAGGAPRVRVFAVDLQTGAVDPVADFFGFEDSFRSGVRVAAGNVVPRADRQQIILGADSGGGPRVRVLELNNGQVTTAPGPLGDFFALDPNFRGGVRVAAGELDGNPNDGDELVVAAGPTGGPRVQVYRADGAVLADFFAFRTDFGGGVEVAVRPTGGAVGQVALDAFASDPSQRNEGLNVVAGVGAAAGAAGQAGTGAGTGGASSIIAGSTAGPGARTGGTGNFGGTGTGATGNGTGTPGTFTTGTPGGFTTGFGTPTFGTGFGTTGAGTSGFGTSGFTTGGNNTGFINQGSGFGTTFQGTGTTAQGTGFGTTFLGQGTTQQGAGFGTTFLGPGTTAQGGGFGTTTQTINTAQGGGFGTNTQLFTTTQGAGFGTTFQGTGTTAQGSGFGTNTQQFAAGTGGVFGFGPAGDPGQPTGRPTALANPPFAATFVGLNGSTGTGGTGAAVGTGGSAPAASAPARTANSFRLPF